MTQLVLNYNLMFVSDIHDYYFNIIIIIELIDNTNDYKL